MARICFSERRGDEREDLAPAEEDEAREHDEGRCVVQEDQQQQDRRRL
jgi:hypothetical protein